MKWAISQHPIPVNKSFSSFEYNHVFFYANETHFFREFEDGLRIAVEGYVCPRTTDFELYKHLEQYDLVYTLFREKGSDFIDSIKGVFNLILITGNVIRVYNDRHSIKKFFICTKNGHYLVANDLSFISEHCDLTYSEENTAVFSLMEHFIDGITLFNEVVYSRPATRLLLAKTLKIESYWAPGRLLDKKIEPVNVEDFAVKWKTIIKQHIDYLKPKHTTMTLTGGNDSRMVLAALLNAGIAPDAFTFGNPASADCVVAKKIAAKIGLNYNNYDVAHPTPAWFRSKAGEIIAIGHSLINIHRAHRLDAVEKEMANHPGDEMILAGFMGGDYIKGIIYDDYITARLIRLWEFDRRDRRHLIKEELQRKYINFTEPGIEKLVSFFEKQDFFSAGRRRERQFHYVYRVVGAVHDVQDTNIFGSRIRYTVNPFMDTDFLEMLFSSKFSMMFKNNHPGLRFNRLLHPLLHCQTIALLCPELNDIEFAKKGFYTPAELLGNPFVYYVKRILRYFRSSKYPANFPYGQWLGTYCAEEIARLEPEIKHTFDISAVMKSLEDDDHYFTEAYWHKFTNIINLNKIITYYKKNDL